MGLTSYTGLRPTVTQRPILRRQKTEPSDNVELRCEVTPAPFILRPYAGIYNPFPQGCSVLCNHPTDTDAKQYVRRVKEVWSLDGKSHHFHEDLSKFHDGQDKEKIKTPHDIVTEDMFRRYTETDSRPLTPAPTLASGKSRGSRRCLTPDQPHTKTAIVLDLRRSHSQETIYYHGYTTSELTAAHTTSATNDRSTLPSLNLSEGAHNRLIKGQCEQLPPLASPLVLSKRAVKEPVTVRTVKKNQLKALNLGKPAKSKNKTEVPTSQRSKGEKEQKETNVEEESEAGLDSVDDGGGESRRRGKRRRKGGRVGSDRLTSAGLAAQAQQDPETQIAGIVSDSQNPSSRGSIAPSGDEDLPCLPTLKPPAPARKTDSFLDDDMLKYLHRDVDEDAIETEFDIKRRYVLEEALRTRPDRPHNPEMQLLLREMKVPAMSLGDWLHIPRVFSRQNAQFTLPIDSYMLEALMPMQYAARFVKLKKSKQLLYLTVLRKFRPLGYRMPISDIQEGLVLMMGGILSTDQIEHFKTIMDWENYEEEENVPDEIKLTLLDTGYRRSGFLEGGDTGEFEQNTLNFRTWCGLCAVCERMFGRFPPRDKDFPEGMEMSDFTMLETKLVTLKVHPGLVEILTAIRVR